MPKIDDSPAQPLVSALQTERLAVNLSDLERLSQEIWIELRLRALLDPDKRNLVTFQEEREAAVRFKCDLLTAACICDTLREHDRRCKDYPTRVYIQRVSAWERIPGDALLTLMVDRQPRLNPKLFKVRVRARPMEVS